MFSLVDTVRQANQTPRGSFLIRREVSALSFSNGFRICSITVMKDGGLRDCCMQMTVLRFLGTIATGARPVLAY